MSKITKKSLISEIVALDNEIDVEILSSMSIKQLKFQISILQKSKAAIKTAKEAAKSSKPRISRGKSNINDIRSKNLLNYLYDETIVKNVSDDKKSIVIDPITFCYIMNINVTSDRYRMFYRGQKPIAKKGDQFVYCTKDSMSDFIGNTHGSFLHNDYSLKQQIGVWLARKGIAVNIEIPKYSYIVKERDKDGNEIKIVKETIAKIGSCALKKQGFEDSNVDLKMLISTITADEYNAAMCSYMAKDFNCSDDELSDMTKKLSNIEKSENVGIVRYAWEDHLIAHAILSQEIASQSS